MCVCHVSPALLFQERVSGRQQLLRIACNDVAKGDLLAASPERKLCTRCVNSASLALNMNWSSKMPVIAS
ncbi:hypothetical protein SAMN05444506_11579 [Pseudomonas syringae]|nr:hypothetical protein ALQ58_01260 [Pseudomonas syringae pv. apii]SDZ34131.1 hypothetical protein SAMN05444506_11579 [Pseudomonas syringae]